MKLIKKAKTISLDVKTAPANSSIYDIKINSITGNEINLSDFKGKFLLFVNVASKCGFTKQYEDLEKLSHQYKKDLVVIGAPCNQFGNQEPGDSKQILSFCQKNYGVTFLITEKIEVKGKNQHPLFDWLTNKKLNRRKDSTIRWNFQKYLIDRNGVLIDYYFSITNPLSAKITKHIQ